MAEESPKEVVQYTYDKIADWYLDWVETQKSPRERYTRKLLARCPPSPSLLELGCGPGVPVLRMLLEHGADVVANDISAKQLALARERCPAATLVGGDMAALSFAPARFDGVLSFYTLFHLPRAEQHAFLRTVHSWLKPGGTLVCNLATVDEEEIYGEFLGHGMFWSSYGEEESMKMLREAGFDILEGDVLEAGDGKLDEGDPDYGVKFLWIMASRRESGSGESG